MTTETSVAASGTEPSAPAPVGGGCAMLRASIAKSEQRIDLLQRQIAPLDERIAGLEAKPEPDLVQIAFLREHVAELRAMLTVELEGLAVEQREFNHLCGGIPPADPFRASKLRVNLPCGEQTIPEELHAPSGTWLCLDLSISEGPCVDFTSETFVVDPPPLHELYAAEHLPFMRSYLEQRLADVAVAEQAVADRVA